MTSTHSSSRLQSAQDVLDNQLVDPEFRAIWERLAPARAVAMRLVGYRVEHGLTQTALGRRLGMPQAAVARLESGDHVPSIQTLIRLADALDLEFLVSISPHRHGTLCPLPAAESASVIERATTDCGGQVLVAITSSRRRP